MSVLIKPFIYPIVGTSFRPPAAKILRILPLGTPLELLSEPTNKFDPNAIAVYFTWNAIDSRTSSRIAEALSDEPPETQDEIVMSDSWHLGYLPATVAQYLQTEQNFPSTPIAATLVFPETKRGNTPHVRFTL